MKAGAIMAGAGLAAAVAVAVHAQSDGGNRASNFTTVEYYGPTNPTQPKCILSGAEASPQPGGLLVIRQFRLRMFDPAGKPTMVVTAPECIYDTTAETASSAGPLHLENGDGTFRLDGEGFLWRQTNSFLNISNQVRTVVENGAKIDTKP